MRRTSMVLVAAALLVALAGGLASASTKPERIGLRRTGVGTILVNGRGFTVYVFTKDSTNHDVCVQIRGCARVWPPLTSAAKAVAGSGLKSSLVGSISIPGAKQVTYAGHPLYRYSGDTGPGQTGYVNFSAFGGHWPALNAAGQEVR